MEPPVKIGLFSEALRDWIEDNGIKIIHGRRVEIPFEYLKNYSPKKSIQFLNHVFANLYKVRVKSIKGSKSLFGFITKDLNWPYKLPEEVFENKYVIRIMSGVSEYELKKFLEKVIKLYANPIEIKNKLISYPNIFYDEMSGSGYVNSKKFKFKDHKSEFRIFRMLYEKINKTVNKYDVLVAGYFYEEGEEPVKVRKNSETVFINEIAKSIRKKTGLSTSQLVLNNGNLTLRGQKIGEMSQI